MIAKRWMVFLCFCGTASLLSQQPKSQHIGLDVVVTEKGGAPVSGLGQSDFTVLDNKQPQPITQFRAADSASQPDVPSVFLVIDRVNTSFQTSGRAREELNKFLKQDGGRLAQPLSLVFFSDSGTQVSPATADGNALAEVLDKSDSGLRTVRRSQGIYGAQDRFQLSLRTLLGLAQTEAGKPGRKILIWISPGWPLLSGPHIELTTKQEGEIFNEIVNVSNALIHAHITLYSVDPLGTTDALGYQTTYYENFLKGVSSPKQAQAGSLALQVLAHQSGGRVLNGNNDLAAMIRTCLSDLHSYYILDFDSPPSDSASLYHALEVRVDKPGMKAMARTGYYAATQ